MQFSPRLAMGPAWLAFAVATALVLGPGSPVHAAERPAFGQPPDKAVAALLAEQKWAEALAAIDRQLKARPNDVTLLMDRGAVLSALERGGEALATFRKVATLQPELPAAHNNMAVILAAMGRYGEARAALERAIRLQPGYATAHENLGDLYAHLAGDSYRQALQADRTLKSAKAKLERADDLVALATGVATANKGSAPAAAVAPSLAAAAAAPPVAVAASQAPGGAQAAVEAAVRGWAKAWADRDVEGYLGAYAPEFKGNAADPETWRRERGARIASTSRIEVRLSDLSVRVDGDRAAATFVQNFDSSVPRSRARTGKTLKLQRVQGRWLIREEIRR